MRINKAIDLLEQCEPLYYAPAGELTFENGLLQAKTWADFLIVDYEHNPFDVAGLVRFMRGLVDGGPTNSGHRTPAVIATLPSNCRTAEEVHANAWQIRQVLSAGVHGILHTHARQPEAVRAFVESTRYPFQTAGIGRRLGEGQRGSGGQNVPANIWGISPDEYLIVADPWPLNPDGELLLGLKIEDRLGLANARTIARVPGIAFAEWGPGDMGMSFGHPNAHDPPYSAEMERARQEIKAACDENGIAFLSSWNDPNQSIAENVQILLDQGVRIISGSVDFAREGRKKTGRNMPV